MCAGVVVGVVFYIKTKTLREDPTYRFHFSAMVQSAAFQLLLLLTEILTAANLETRSMPWRAVFTPVYVLLPAASVGLVWSCCKKRTVEIQTVEIAGMVSFLQFIFLGIRLDGLVHWRWVIVFIPTWILLVVFIVGVAMYSCFRLVVFRCLSSEQQGRSPLSTIVMVVCLFVMATCLILFTALLVTRLDGKLEGQYAAIFVPLHIVVLALLVTAVVGSPDNPWWFGMRKTFVELALDKCPILQEYMNVSYSKEGLTATLHKDDTEDVATLTKLPVPVNSSSPSKYPYEDIFLPD
eukprot:Em0022g322a